MKKVLALALSIAMILSVCSVFAFAAGEAETPDTSKMDTPPAESYFTATVDAPDEWLTLQLAGENLNVTVTIENTSDVAFGVVNFLLYYDAADVEPVLPAKLADTKNYVDLEVWKPDCLVGAYEGKYGTDCVFGSAMVWDEADALNPGEKIVFTIPFKILADASGLINFQVTNEELYATLPLDPEMNLLMGTGSNIAVAPVVTGGDDTSDPVIPSVDENDIFARAEGLWTYTEVLESNVTVDTADGVTVIGSTNGAWPSAAAVLDEPVLVREGQGIGYDVSFASGGFSLRFNGQNGLEGNSVHGLFDGATIDGAGDLIAGSFAGTITYAQLAEMFGTNDDGAVEIKEITVFSINSAVITFNKFHVVEVGGTPDTSDPDTSTPDDPVVPPVDPDDPVVPPVIPDGAVFTTAITAPEAWVAGETFVVTVEIKNISDIALGVVNFVLNYDNTQLEAVLPGVDCSGSASGAWGNNSTMIGASGDNGVFAFAMVEDEADAIANGESVVLTFNFKVLPSASADAAFSIEANEDLWAQKVLDPEMVNLEGVGSSATVKAPEITYLKGDVDGSGKANSDDAIHLLMHTLYPDRYEINQPADFDGSGKVNSDDAIYLLMFTLYPDRYPLS